MVTTLTIAILILQVEKSPLASCGAAAYAGEAQDH
jgi:hypothetical protein